MYVGTQRAIEKNDEKAKEVKVKYERQLSDLRSELRSLKSARKEHAKAMKKNVCEHVVYVYHFYTPFANSTINLTSKLM